MNGQPVISVRGEASVEVEPEVAIVNVTEARDRDRRTVLGRLASRNQHVTALIKRHGEAVEKLESGPASVRPDIRDKKTAGERVAGYLGLASVRITVRDFTVLGELVTGLSDEDLVTVAGPWWALRPDSPVYRDARLAAARDAIVRAREYAEAFGGGIGGLIEAADAGLLTSPGEHGSRLPAIAAGRAVGFAGRPPQAELDFEPARQTVTAQVEARFAMTMPAS